MLEQSIGQRRDAEGRHGAEDHVGGDRAEARGEAGGRALEEGASDAQNGDRPDRRGDRDADRDALEQQQQNHVRRAPSLSGASIAARA